MAEITLTADNFDSAVVKSTIPVLIDFWAPWCMPCRMIAPMLEEMSVQYAGKLTVGKINVDQEGDLANRFNIVSIPTLVVFKDGEMVRQRVGALPRPEIENLVKDLVQ
jgi:thioredoxin 1